MGKSKCCVTQCSRWSTLWMSREGRTCCWNSNNLRPLVKKRESSPKRFVALSVASAPHTERSSQCDFSAATVCSVKEGISVWHFWVCLYFVTQKKTLTRTWQGISSAKIRVKLRWQVFACLLALAVPGTLQLEIEWYITNNCRMENETEGAVWLWSDCCSCCSHLCESPEEDSGCFCAVNGLAVLMLLWHLVCLAKSLLLAWPWALGSQIVLIGLA